MKVPQLNGNQVTTARTPDIGRLPTPSIESFGGGSGNVIQAATKVAKVVDDIYQEQKKKADDIAVDEAKNKAVLKETELLYSKDGALKKQGKDAFGQVQYVNEEYAKFSEEIMSSLSNDEQRAKFRAVNSVQRTSIDRSLNNHVSNEIIRHENNVGTALIDNEANAAALAYTDMNRVAQAVETQTETLQKLAKSNGWSDEELKQKSDQVVSRTHAGVIKSMLDNDLEGAAESYYSANKGFIQDKEVVAQIQNQIEVGSNRKKSQGYVDDAISKGLSESQALNQIPKEDAKLREQMEQRVRYQYGLRDAAKRDGLEKISINTLNAIDKGQVTDLTKTPGWTQMDRPQRDALTNYLNAKVSGKAIQTDRSAYYELQQMTPDNFSKLDLRTYSDKLDSGTFEKFVDMQKELRSGKTKEFDTFLSDSDAVRTVFVEAGLGDPASKNEEYAQFQLDVAREQQRIQSSTGKKMNDQELADLAKKRATTKVLKQGWIWDEAKPKYKITQEEIDAITVSDIPKEEKAKIDAALTKGKLPLTDANRLEAYKRSIK